MLCDLKTCNLNGEFARVARLCRVLCIKDRAEWRGTAAAQLLRACEERAVGHNWASWRTEHLQLHQILLVSGAISRQGDISYLHSRLPICLKQRAADTWGADLPTAGCLCHVMLTADLRGTGLYFMSVQRGQRKKRRSLVSVYVRQRMNWRQTTQTHTPLLAVAR